MTGSSPPADPARAKSAKSNALVRAVTEVAAEKLTKGLLQTLQAADNALYDQAEAERQSARQNALLDLRVALRAARMQVVSGFTEGLIREAERAVEKLNQGRTDSGPESKSVESASPFAFGGLDGLSLVDDESLQIEIKVKGHASRVLEKVDEELSLLTARMGVLTANPNLVSPDNPLAPNVVFMALDQQLGLAGFKAADRDPLWKALMGGLPAVIEQVYRDLNRLLASQGILPDLKAGFVKRVGVNSGATGRVKTVPEAPAPKTEQGPVPGMIAPSNSAAFPAPPPGYWSPVPLPFGGGAAMQAHASQLFSGTLTGPAAAVSAPAHQAAFWAQLAPLGQGSAEALSEALLGFDGVNGSYGSPSVLWSARDTPAAAGLTEIEALTIDIVAMLFDYLFDDRNLSTSIKALLGRLQIPILKLAMNDRSFFSNRGHPARTLLDELARAGMGCGPTAQEQDELYAQIADLVDRVLHTENLGSEALLREVDAFSRQIEQLDHDSAAFIEQTRAVAAARADREAVQRSAESAVDARIEPHPLPPEVRHLLEVTWPKVLLRAYAREGDEGAAWRQALETLEELVWSLRPKLEGSDRNRMLTILPGLLRRLQEGVDSVGIDPGERDRFFNVLVDCHSRAMDAERSVAEGGEDYGLWLSEVDRNARRARPTVPHMERARITEAGVRIEEIRLALGSRPAGAEAGFMTLEWPEVEIGQWVEFLESGRGADDEVVRARLTWISPLEEVYLFTNPQLGEALSIAPFALAAQLSAGVARVLDDAAPVERAVLGVQSTFGIALPETRIG
jgi:hypothetical protein